MFEKLKKKYKEYIIENDFLNEKNIYINEYKQSFALKDNIKDNDLQKFERLYFNINKIGEYEKQFYHFLINHDLNKEKDYQFFIIDNKHNSDFNYLEIIKQFINDVQIYRYKQLTIFIYEANCEIDVKNIINILCEECLINIKAIMGIKFSNKDRFYVYLICTTYLAYLSKTNLQYINVSDIILEVVKKDYSFLPEIKKAIFCNIKLDQYNEKVINGMLQCNLNVTKTSSNVYMHRNTINNRLDIIEKETGLNIQKFKDACAMYFLIN